MTTIAVLLADTELKGYALTWTLLTDPIRQKADSTFPPPTNAARRDAHRAGQIRLLRLCEVAFRDYLPSIIRTFTVEQYSDPARVDADGYPYCVGTACFAALRDYCCPRGVVATDNSRERFVAELDKFPGIRNTQQSALVSLEKYCNDRPARSSSMAHVPADAGRGCYLDGYSYARSSAPSRCALGTRRVRRSQLRRR